jgi:hypothetical protein
MRKSVSIFFAFVALLTITSIAFGQASLPGTGWYSGIVVQNVGSGDASVGIVAHGLDGSEASFSNSVSEGAILNILPTDFTGMDAGFQGSAVVSSDKELAAVVNITNRYVSGLGLGDSGASHPGAAQYQGMSIADTELRFPFAKNNNYGKTTTFYIQNAGDAAATATATFVFNDMDYTFLTPSIDPGEMVVFTPSDARDSSNLAPPSGNVATSAGSLTVTSDEPLAGTVLEHKTSEAHGSLLQSTRAFTPADYSNVLYVPMNKDNYYNRWSGLIVQNAGDAIIDISVTYTVGTKDGSCTADAGSTSTTTMEDVDPNASVIFPSADIPGDGCAAAAVVEVVGGVGEVVGVINESFTSAFLSANPTRSQESTTYSAFSADSATHRISIPLYKEDSYNKGSGVTVQNINTSDSAFITVTFISPAGTFVTNQIEIAKSASYNIVDMRLKAASLWDGTAMTPSALGCTSGNFVCAANGLMGLMIESTGGEIVAMANESTYPFSAPRIQQDKNNYEGFNLVDLP